jgi:hypothetical protein
MRRNKTQNTPHIRSDICRLLKANSSNIKCPHTPSVQCSFQQRTHVLPKLTSRSWNVESKIHHTSDTQTPLIRALWLKTVPTNLNTVTAWAVSSNFSFKNELRIGDFVNFHSFWS